MLENILVVAGTLIGIYVIGYVLLLLIFYKKTTQGKALVRTGMNMTKVAFEGMFAVPLLHTVETIDISIKQIVIAHQGKDSLVCKDNRRADLKLMFFIRINPKVEDVRIVARAIGCARASDQHALTSLFGAKFSQTLKTVVKQFDFDQLKNDQTEFSHALVKRIGQDLNGFVLDDVVIEYLAETPVEDLNANDISIKS